MPKYSIVNLGDEIVIRDTKQFETPPDDIHECYMEVIRLPTLALYYAIRCLSLINLPAHMDITGKGLELRITNKPRYVEGERMMEPEMYLMVGETILERITTSMVLGGL